MDRENGCVTSSNPRNCKQGIILSTLLPICCKPARKKAVVLSNLLRREGNKMAQLQLKNVWARANFFVCLELNGSLLWLRSPDVDSFVRTGAVTCRYSSVAEHEAQFSC
jgi:hypothetical protein